MFERLSLWQWRQFARIDIYFHRRLTVLTGANGSGKTTLLNLLSRHFGWSLPLVSTPQYDRKERVLRYLSGRRERKSARLDPDVPVQEVGRILYSEDRSTSILVPENVENQYHLQIPSQASIPGLFIPSHRPAYFYERVEQIPTQVQARQVVLDTYLAELRGRYQRSNPPSPSFRIKEALISWASFGYGNQAVDANPEVIRTFEGFQQILRKVLPHNLGFRSIRVRTPEVIFDTSSGEFSFDAVSGGIAALVDLAWQIYMFSLQYDSFVVAIDEPENHLHPQLQREVLPTFVSAFPTLQFVVATHNPLVVGSVEDSSVYVLRYGSDRRVRSELLDLEAKAGTANEILRDVLDVATSVPRWAADEVEEMLRELSSGGRPTVEQVRAVDASLRRLGLGHLAPEALERLLSQE